MIDEFNTENTKVLKFLELLDVFNKEEVDIPVGDIQSLEINLTKNNVNI